MGERRAGLDGLRGWAVLAVVAFHCGVLRAGWVGVDLFMALSGFLITGVLIGELARRDALSVGTFWRRRARRLWPALLALLLGVALISWGAPDGWPTPTRRETIGALTYTSNWLRLGAHSSYWELFRLPSALDHLWSLAIEEQFYVIWPLVVLAAWRLGKRRGVAIAAVVLALALSTWQIVLSFHGASVERLYVGTDTRAPAFLAGAVACLLAGSLSADPSARARRARRWLPITVGGLVLACLFLDGAARSTYRGPLLVVSALGAATAYGAAALDGTRRLDLVFVAAPQRLLGRWSYGVYLFHWPLLVLIGVTRWAPGVRFGVVLLLSVALAAASYELYEGRIRVRGLPGRWLPVGVAVASSIAAVALLTSAAPREELDRASAEELTTPLPAAAARPVAAGVGGEAGGGVGVGIGADPQPTRVLVVGDSVVYELADEFVALGEQRGMEVGVRAAPGCTMSTEVGDQNNGFTTQLCARIRLALAADVKRFRPQRVIMFLGGTWAPFVWHGERLDPCSAAGGAALGVAGDAYVADLTASGAEVDLVVPPQMAGAYGAAAPGAAQCYAAAYEALAGRHPATVDLVRLDRLVCAVDAPSCAEVVDGVRLRHDGLHYTVEGGHRVVGWIYDEVAAPPSS